MSQSQTITEDQVKKAMIRVGVVHNELVRARRQLAELLATAKEQGLFVSSSAHECASGCACDASVRIVS